MKASIILFYLIAFTTALYCDYGIKVVVTCNKVCLYPDYNFSFISNANFYLYIGICLLCKFYLALLGLIINKIRSAVTKNRMCSRSTVANALSPLITPPMFLNRRQCLFLLVVEMMG